MSSTVSTDVLTTLQLSPISANCSEVPTMSNFCSIFFITERPTVYLHCSSLFPDSEVCIAVFNEL